MEDKNHRYSACKKRVSGDLEEELSPSLTGVGGPGQADLLQKECGMRGRGCLVLELRYQDKGQNSHCQLQSQLAHRTLNLEGLGPHPPPPLLGALVVRLRLPQAVQGIRGLKKSLWAAEAGGAVSWNPRRLS